MIVDDHALLRAGIRALLQFHPDLEVVAEAADGASALRLVQQERPDVILMDIGLPDIDGLTATRRILASEPTARVLILTQHENREYVLPALRTGAAGYILKRTPDDTMVRAIRTVHQGRTFVDPALGEVLAEGVRRQGGNAPPDPYDELTTREREVLVLLARGKTYQEVAATLFISVKTVDFHRANLMRKLDLPNRAALTRLALERGLLE